MIRSIGMALLKLLLSSGLIFHVATAIMNKPYGKHSEDIELSVEYENLPQHVKPLHYEMNIIFPIGSNTLYGESNITIDVLHDTHTISLHSRHLYIDQYIDSPTLTNETSKEVYVPSYSCYVLDHRRYYYLSDFCTFYFDEKILMGLYVLNLKFRSGIFFHGTSGDDFEITYINNVRNQKMRMFAIGDFRTTNGAQWIFPCWDELTFKATFTISVKHPKNYTAISNMPIQSTEDVEANMMWTHFQTTPTMPTYLVAFMMAEFIHTSNNDINIWYKDWQTASQLNCAQNIAEAIANYLETIYFRDIKELIKIPKIDQVAIPSNMHIRKEGLTNWGLVFYSEAAIIYDEKSNSIRRMMEVAFVVARKIVHQWFGNVVTPVSWSQMWLNEGIATFLGLYAADKVFPHFRMMDLFAVLTRYKSLHLETNDNMPPIAIEINDPFDINLFSSFRYSKASAVLRMLHYLITDELFQKGIHNYLHNHMLRSASPDDLWAVMQTVLDKSDHEYKFNIKELMDTWTTQSHYPVLKMVRNYRNGYTIIWPEIPNTSEQNEWWIPVTYATQTHPNFNVTFVQEWLSPQKSLLFLPSINTNDWIIINLQQIGYYRVMYDRENWRRIADYLNSDEYNKIHVLNRAQIIDDAYYFLIKKQLGYDIFEYLTKYLLHDTDYVAWYPMFRIFENMLHIFSHPEATFIKVHMRNIVIELLKKIGYDDKPDEDILIKSLRLEAAEWACTLGDENCRELAHQKLQDYVDNFTGQKDERVSSWKKWIYCGGLMTTSDDTIWREMLSVAADNVILEYLPCVKEPDTITTYLEIIKLNELVSHDKYINIFVSVMAMHANNDEMLACIFAAFERVRPRNLTFLETIRIIIKYMYTEDQFSMIEEFVYRSEGSHVTWDVKREIDKQLSETKDMLDFLKGKTIPKSLNHSKVIYFDYNAIDTFIELMC